MSEQLEKQIENALIQQGKNWIKTLLIVVIQTIGICAFAFTLRADVNANKEKLIYNEERLQKLEDNQRDLIRVLIVVEMLQKNVSDLMNTIKKNTS